MGRNIGLSLDEMINGIENLKIYESDYHVIQQLLESEPKFFVKVLEEVILDNISFSDFSRMFSDDTYADILRGNFESQRKLTENIEKYKKHMIALGLESSLVSFDEENKFGISRPSETSSKISDLYNQLLQEKRDELVFQLFSDSKNDTEITKAAKLRVFNAIQNFQLADLDGSLDEKKVSIKEGKLEYLIDGETETAEYLNPDDILFFVKDAILPIDYSSQTLDSIDQDFMIQNNLGKEEMKKIKSLSLFLRRKSFLGGS